MAYLKGARLLFGIMWLLCLKSFALQGFTVANTSVEINVKVSENGIALTGLKDSQSGQVWLSNPTELFELAEGPSVWHSDSNLVTDAVLPGGNSSLTFRGHTPNEKFYLEIRISVPEDSGPASITGSISNRSEDWFGPFLLGDAGISPVFPGNAEFAPVRRTPNHEEILVTGFDGLLYTSEERDDGPWSTPRSLQPTNSQWRDLFLPGSPIAAIRRNDHQADAFSISKNGHLYTVFRVDENWWSDPVLLDHADTGPFQPAGSIAALAVDEHADPPMGPRSHINEVVVFGVSSTGHVLESREVNDGPFSQPALLAQASDPQPIGTDVHLAAIKRNQKQQDLFAIDSQGMLRTTFHLSGNMQWSNWIVLSRSDVIVPNSHLAAVRGSGDDEYVFLVGPGPAQFPGWGSIYETHEKNDGAWSELSSVGSSLPTLAPGGAISAVRRSGGEIDVFAVLSDGTIGIVTRSLDGSWSPIIFLPKAQRVASDAKIAAILRSTKQLDVFGITSDSGRLWTSGDGLGSTLLRSVFPKILFSRGDALTGSFGMIPQEVGSLTQLQGDHGFNILGMPYANDPIAGDIGLPQAMNSLEVANIARHGRSLFFADLNGSVEAGRAPIQFTLSPSELDGFWVTHIKGGQQVQLPSFAIGVADGDFRQSVDYYLAHHPADLHTPDTPKWLREAGAIYAPTGGGYGGIFLWLPGVGAPLPIYAANGCAEYPAGFRCVFRRMRTEAEALETDVLYLADYWEGTGGHKQDCPNSPDPYSAPYFCKGDYIIREDMGGLAELTAAIDEAHKPRCTNPMGAQKRCTPARVILYLEPFITYATSFVGSAYAELWGSITPFSGSDVWKPFYDAAHPDESVAMSQANAEWQNYIVDAARTLVQQTHADGIFLDSGGWRLNIPSWTRQEAVSNSSLENAMAFLNLADRVRAAIRTVNPDAVVLTETTSGPLWRHVDGGVSADFGNSGPGFTGTDTIGGHLLTSPTRYALPQMNFFSNGQNLNQLNQIFATGHSLALSTNWDAAPSWIYNNAPYIKQLVLARKRLASALVYGRQISQFDVIGVNGSSGVAYVYEGPPNVMIVLNYSENGTGFTGRISPSQAMGLGTRWVDALTGEQLVVGLSGLALSVAAPPPTASAGKCLSNTSCGLRILVQQPAGIYKRTPGGH